MANEIPPTPAPAAPGILALLVRALRLQHPFDLKFYLRQRLLGFQVPEQPYFEDPAATDWFRGRLAAAKAYLEFGSGGSTVEAARQGVPFVAVDSDRYFLCAVEAKIVALGLADPGRQVFRHADIGLTGSWGRPALFRRPGTARLAAFAAYSDPPPGMADGSFMPDLVLVDGRFRVACALKAIRALAGREGWTLVVDDYAERPHYREVERFARLARRVGRMAVFDAALPCPAGELDAAIHRFETLPD